MECISNREVTESWKKLHNPGEWVKIHSDWSWGLEFWIEAKRRWSLDRTNVCYKSRCLDCGAVWRRPNRARWYMLPAWTQSRLHPGKGQPCPLNWGGVFLGILHCWRSHRVILLLVTQLASNSCILGVIHQHFISGSIFANAWHQSYSNKNYICSGSSGTLDYTLENQEVHLMESKFPRNQEGVSLLSGAVCRLSRLGREHTKDSLYWAAGPGRSSSEVHSMVHESQRKLKQ